MPLLTLLFTIDATENDGRPLFSYTHFTTKMVLVIILSWVSKLTLFFTYYITSLQTNMANYIFCFQVVITTFENTLLYLKQFCDYVITS